MNDEAPVRVLINRRLLMVMFMAAVVLSAAALLPLRTWTASYRQYRQRQALISAANALSYRLIEARLPDAFNHRPLLRVRGSSEDTSASGSRLTAAAKRLKGSIIASGPAPDAHTLAEADLMLGDPNGAIRGLESRLMDGQAEPVSVAEAIFQSSDLVLLTDLAAAYYTRGSSTSHAVSDFLCAAAAASRAYQLQPSSLPAAWNRALSLNGLGLAREARDAWSDYVRLDARSEWADEARQHIAELGWQPASETWQASVLELEKAVSRHDGAVITGIASRFPIRTKQYAEEVLIPRWAAASIEKSDAVDPLFDAIAAASLGIGKMASDRQLADWCDAAKGAPDRVLFARAHSRLAEAKRVYGEKGTMEAIAILDVALKELRQAGSPMAATVAVQIGGHYYHAGKHSEGIRILDEADNAIRDRSWPLIAARSSWNRAVALTSLGQIGQAAASYTHAIELYRAAGDETFSGMLEMLSGHNAEWARNFELAWPRYIDGVRLAERYGDPDRVVVVLDTFCRAALREGHPGVAMLLNDALIARSQAPDFRPYRCHALITRCEFEARRGNRREASAQCSAARQIWSSIPDAAVRGRLEADLDLGTAASVEPRVRIDMLTGAVDTSVKRQDLYRLSQVLLLRGQAYVESGATRLARSDFEQALAVVEQERQRLETVPDRLTYFDTSRTIAQELVRLLVRTGETDEALRVVDRVRARLLLDQISGFTASPDLSIDSVRRRLDPHRAVVEYWADTSELFTWVIRKDGTSFKREPTGRRSIETAARRFVDSFASPSAVTGQADSEAAFLDQHLAAPLKGNVTGIDSLTIVPDESFADVPFAALRDPNGSYLIQQFTLTRAASLSAFVAAGEWSTHRDSVLIVAEPEMPESLARLDVRNEVSAAMHATHSAKLLEGKDATANALRTSVRDFDILHIATHAFDRYGEPVLVLTPAGASDEGFLRASEVEKTFSVRRGSLVILAACSTARGRASSDGTMSMARAFLVAGAGSVIASLWNADDRDSGRIFSAFYAAIREGASPAAALRSAQLSLLKSESHIPPQRWAAYQIYGGA